MIRQLLIFWERQALSFPYVPGFLLVLGLCAGSLPVTAQSGLVAHYKFNNEYADQSGNRNNGRIIGSLNYTEDRFGNNCSALGLDGRSFLQVPSSPSLNAPSKNLTIAAWVKAGVGSNTDLSLMWFTICSKGYTATETPAVPQYRLQVTSQTVSINTDFTENFYQHITPEAWYHCAVTYDGSLVSLYMNGKKVFSYPYSGTLLPNNEPLEVGRDIPGSTEYHYGALDDVMIFSRVLSATQIQNLYNDQTEKGGNGVVCQTNAPPPPQNSRKIIVDKIDTVYNRVVINVTDTVRIPRTVQVPVYDTVFVNKVIRVAKTDTVYDNNTVTVVKADTVYNRRTVELDRVDTVYNRRTVELEKVDTVFTRRTVEVPDSPLLTGDTFRLEHVYFKRSQAVLLASSFDELNNLATVLKENPGIHIQLDGHTDNVGDPQKNMKLSLDRVISVKDYLVEHGIAENRLTYKAFGQTRPLNKNRNETERRQNRRVEVTVTKR